MSVAMRVAPLSKVLVGASDPSCDCERHRGPPTSAGPTVWTAEQLRGRMEFGRSMSARLLVRPLPAALTCRSMAHVRTRGVVRILDYRSACHCLARPTLTRSAG
jgi:hypothetical protein